MLKDIVFARATTEHKLFLRFEDGVEGEVDIAKLVRFTGVFDALKQLSYFRQVRVNSELGTIYWPNGADLDPDVLYSEVSGQPLPIAELA